MNAARPKRTGDTTNLFNRGDSVLFVEPIFNQQLKGWVLSSFVRKHGKTYDVAITSYIEEQKKEFICLVAKSVSESRAVLVEKNIFKW